MKVEDISTVDNNSCLDNKTQQAIDNDKQNSIDKNDGLKKFYLYETLSKFASITSINGLVFIETSVSRTVKFIWSLLVMSAFSALVFHSYSIVSDYLDYGTKSVVERIMNKSILFPAVTICNINPIRLSKINITNDDLIDLVNNMSSESLLAYDRSNTSTNNWKQYFSLGDNVNSSQPTASDQFFELSKTLDRDIFNQAGHQINDMLLYCKLADQFCSISDFKLFSTFPSGNCYTLYKENVSIQVTGANAGLILWLYLEPDEYIPGVTTDKGIEIEIHDHQVFSYPSYDGFTLLPGTMTYVAINLEETSRLGKPYSTCVEPDDYLNKYNITYRQDICDELEWNNQTFSFCQCKSDSSSPLIYDMLNIPQSTMNCESSDNDYSACVNAIPDISVCDIPCREQNYDVRESSTQWPDFTTSQALVEFMCEEKNLSKERCDQLKNQSARDLRENFAGVNIYMSSLSINKYSYSPDVSTAEFLSNLGGCMGLWVGVSVLSLFEVIDLIVGIISSLIITKNTAKVAAT